MINLLVYFTFYILIFFSIVGYGTALAKKNENNIGIIGFSGIFLLIIISYITNYIFHHGYYHNSIILLIGIIFFVFNSKNIFKHKILNSKIYAIILTILFMGLLISKNHDDFFYYHFGYTLSLINFTKIIGIGHLEHGFRTPSSIFYLNSLFYLPYIKYFMLHSGAIFFMIFSNFFFIEKIYYLRKIKSKNYYLLFLATFSLIFINTVFYRIAEHGTDRSAFLLIFVGIFLISEFLNFKKTINSKNLIDNFYFLLIIFFLIISLKTFYFIYLILLIYILFHFKRIFFTKKNLNNIIYNKITLLFFIGIFTLLVTNILNTGCIIYPASFSCFENLSWSIPKDEVVNMKIWYELWSKAGATPNFRIEDSSVYLSSFNWVNNWFKTYFFTKVSDLILIIFIILIIMFFLFKDHNKYDFTLHNKNIYIITILLFIQWFVSYPALRYGGYAVLTLIIFLPFCSFITLNVKNLNIFKKVFSLIIISYCIFIYKNIDRIFYENKKYNYNVVLDPFYKIDDRAFVYDKKLKSIYKLRFKEKGYIILKKQD